MRRVSCEHNISFNVSEANEETRLMAIVLQFVMLFATFGGTLSIIGGQDSTRFTFHGIVAIQTHVGQTICAGTHIVNPKTQRAVIITAAHCVNHAKDKPSHLRVVGADLLSSQNSATWQRQIRLIQRVLIHPEFNAITLENDVAILHLTEHFRLWTNMEFVPLQIAHHDILSYKNCSVAGWGSITEDTDMVEKTETLQITYVQINPKSITDPCLTADNENTFTANGRNGGNGPWNGDDGTGLVCNGILTGIFHKATNCKQLKGNDFYVGQYMNVYRYREWIMWNSSSLPKPQLFLVFVAPLSYLFRFVF